MIKFRRPPFKPIHRWTNMLRYQICNTSVVFMCHDRVRDHHTIYEFFISLHSFRSIDILLLMYPSVLYLSSNLFGCCQTKESLRTFLQSLMSKCGKLRQCVKEIKGKYVDDASSVFLEYIRFYFIRSVLLFPLVSLQYGTRHRCLQGLLLSYKSTSRP